MRNLINRLDAICHPFPGIHVLGLISSVLCITSLILWPTVGEIGGQSDQTMPIPALAKTLKTNQQLVPRSEPFVIRTERVQAGDSLSRLFSRQHLKPQLLHTLTQAEQGNRRISMLAKQLNSVIPARLSSSSQLFNPHFNRLSQSMPRADGLSNSDSAIQRFTSNTLAQQSIVLYLSQEPGLDSLTI